MSATALQLNWSSVEFASTPLTRVTAIMFDQGGELIEFAGDNDRYPVVIANPMNRPRCSITSADVATLMGIAPGTSGTITATQVDALEATGGSIVWASPMPYTRAHKTQGRSANSPRRRRRSGPTAAMGRQIRSALLVRSLLPSMGTGRGGSGTGRLKAE